MKNQCIKIASLLFLFSLVSGQLHAQKKKKYDYIVTISTELGEFKMVLFDEAPKHKENFVKLAEQGFYDSTTFHRVLEGFMIQGGDPNSKPSGNGQLGTGGPGYLIDAEIVDEYKHDRGMVAAARMGDAYNPEQKSNGSQFYVVQSEEGAHHLDGEYTVFGRVFEGMEVVDEIAKQKVNRKGLPSKPIYMKVVVEKLKRKKITKTYGLEY